jgi:ATP-dependent Clp endopeptidase proteolytic subunit ClpP
MEGHIWINDVIERDYHLEVKRQMDALKGATSLVVHIQSPGGSVAAGFNTYHVLKAAGKPIKTIIEGEAQSIATFIALAGDTVEIRNPSIFMIHNPWNEIQGDADSLEAGASELRNLQRDLAEAYSRKTGIPIDQIQAMMKKETVMSAQQAVQMKFADRIVEPIRAVALGKSNHNMHQNKELSAVRKALAACAFALGFGPQNIDLTLADGNILQVDGDGDLMGKPAMLNGAPAPDGVYPLTDGRSVTVAGGVVTEVKEAAAAAPAPAAPPAPAPAPVAPPAPSALESRVQALENELASAKAAVDQEKASAAQASKAKEEAEAKATAAEEKVKATAQAFSTLKAEFDKFTVGNASPPSAAATPRAAGGSNADAAFAADQWAELLDEPAMLGVKNALAMSQRK